MPVHNTLALKGALLPCFCVLGPVFGLAAQLREQQLEEEQVDMYVPLLWPPTNTHVHRQRPTLAVPRHVLQGVLHRDAASKCTNVWHLPTVKITQVAV